MNTLTVLFAALKIASFSADISPEIGANICGYAPGQKSCEKHDPLEACGLLLDDGNRTALLVSFDLLGLDGFYLRELRGKCAKILGTKEELVFFTCTHTHEGPESVRRLNLPESIDAQYIASFEERFLAAVREVATKPRMEVKTLYHSVQVDENRNRRYVTADNHGSFMPHQPTLSRICDGYADKELGLLWFKNAANVAWTPGGDGPDYVIGNYAAHALAAHSPGLGGIRISADYPGFYREYLKRETGSASMLIGGAAGNLVPRGDELGMAEAKRMGEHLAKMSIRSIIEANRGQSRFVVADPKLGGKIVKFSAPMRSKYRNKVQHEYDGDVITLEVQMLAIGDFAFVGMPGEASTEIGSEVKWHSPFRRTWIANLSTGFAGYISPANAFVQGGYEPKKQPFSCRAGLKLVNAAVDGLFELRRELFPQDGTAEDAYPDNLDLPIVSIPGGQKETNFRLNEEKLRK